MKLRLSRKPLLLSLNTSISHHPYTLWMSKKAPEKFTETPYFFSRRLRYSHVLNEGGLGTSSPLLSKLSKRWHCQKRLPRYGLKRVQDWRNDWFLVDTFYNLFRTLSKALYSDECYMQRCSGGEYHGPAFSAILKFLLKTIRPLTKIQINSACIFQ